MKIVSQIRPDRQTVLFSATFPKQMEALARKILATPLEITVGGRSVVAAEIEQQVEVREESTKFNRLLEILGRFYNPDARPAKKPANTQGEFDGDGDEAMDEAEADEVEDNSDARTLVFVDRQEAADNLFRELLKKGYPCLSLHGGKEQVDRDQVISDFKAGVTAIVIATSVAARGLDVKQLKLVINYDAPNHMEDYVHRAGRTGRAGNKGTCITFITPDQDRYAVDLLRALVASKASYPEELKTMSDGASPIHVQRDKELTNGLQRFWKRSGWARRRRPARVSAARAWTIWRGTGTQSRGPRGRPTASRRRKAPVPRAVPEARRERTAPGGRRR